ncbi:hypothetical protein LINGRAHAP2_LOCUS35045 [Linum grandiflorum]
MALRGSLSFRCPIQSTITNVNLSGKIPKHLVDNLTHIDFSRNNLKRRIPSSIVVLENLQSLNL